MRAKLQAAKNQGVDVTELDDLIELPDTMTYIWLYFSELHNARTSSGFGINPISYSDMHGYFQLMKVEPADWEIRAIKKLDNIAIDNFSEDMKKQQAKAKSKK